MYDTLRRAFERRKDRHVSTAISPPRNSACPRRERRSGNQAIRFGKLWDGHKIIANAVVVIDNDKIQNVATNAPVPAGAEFIDLSRYTAIPGMIDVHTHMTYYWDPTSGTDPRRQSPRHVASALFQLA